MKYEVTDIIWDVDNPSDLERLPKRVVITFCDYDDEMDEIDLVIGDYLSHRYEFCTKGFSFKQIG